MTVEEAIEILKGAIQYHEDDLKFPQNVMDKIQEIVLQMDRVFPINYNRLFANDDSAYNVRNILHFDRWAARSIQV